MISVDSGQADSGVNQNPDVATEYNHSNTKYIFMKSLIYLIFLISVVAASGCGEKQDPLAVVPETIPQASAQLKRVFDQASPEIRQHTDRLIAAYDKGNLEEAAGMVLQLQENLNLNFDQQMAIRNSRGSLEKNLARGVESGDPKAIAAWRRLQGSAAVQ